MKLYAKSVVSSLTRALRAGALPWPHLAPGPLVRGGLGLTAGILLMMGCAIAPQPKTGPYHSSDAPVSITRIVHGSYVVDLAGVRALVDPWYYPRGVFNQREPLGLTFRSLPTIHALLITHGHRDHLDIKALKALPDHVVPVITPRGLGKAVARAGYGNVRELDWWETAEIGDLVIHAVPADHTKHANGYVLERGGRTVYAAGETRYFGGLAAVARRFPNIDVALLPIGGLRTAGFLTHMRPRDAARAAHLLRPHRVIPTHYGLVAPLPIYWSTRHPVRAFGRELARYDGSDGGRLVVLETGESWHYRPD